MNAADLVLPRGAFAQGLHAYSYKCTYASFQRIQRKIIGINIEPVKQFSQSLFLAVFRYVDDILFLEINTSTVFEKNGGLYSRWVSL